MNRRQGAEGRGKKVWAIAGRSNKIPSLGPLGSRVISVSYQSAGRGGAGRGGERHGAEKKEGGGVLGQDAGRYGDDAGSGGGRWCGGS